jgi:hypothetical protein
MESVSIGDAHAARSDRRDWVDSRPREELENEIPITGQDQPTFTMEPFGEAEGSIEG